MAMLDEHTDLSGYGAVLRPDWARQIVTERHPLDRSLVCSVAATSPGTGSPVVMLHGVGNNAAIFAPVMPSLAVLGDVVAPTMSPELLIGVGDERFDVSTKLVDWLKAVAPPPWQLVGHSMGGLMAGLILRTRPELVERAVLLNSPLPGVVERIRTRDTLDRTGRALLVMKALARLTAFGRPRLPRLLRGPELAMVRAALRGFVFDPGGLDAGVIIRAILASRTTDGVDFFELAEQLPEWESEPFAAVPVRIMLGADDPLVPSGDLDAITSAYPEAVVTVLDDCGHFVHLEWPQATVDAIVDWFG